MTMSPPKIVSHSAKMDAKEKEAPFLILDLRPREDFDACNITGSVHFPAQNIRHDKITPALQRYKNRKGYIIVLYDNDEALGRSAATTFVEKGFLNTFLLSDGLYR